ncbi:hypothetical protein [Longimicrobium sp.]|uniref:hypothetical protein n=1 Tax=Longimicrobium sp. TaxID=2029185 RepID=UPI002E37AEF3|nr:hypothetical protein [Longimicrobium sp.]HEX6041484.1 hypothetical protein [Longimicrobium sp.]
MRKMEVRSWRVALATMLALAACGDADVEKAPPSRADGVPAAGRPVAQGAAPHETRGRDSASLPGGIRADGSRATVVRLASGDSVEMVAVGPAVVPNQPAGVIVTYHPFFVPQEDTARAVRVAGELWHATVRPGLREPLPPFVVLQATSRRAGPIRGAFTESTFGVVVERREDGSWYRFNTSTVME